MYQTFLATIRMRDVVDQFYLIDLIGVISGDNPMAANHAPAIRSRKLRLVITFLTQVVPHQCFQRRVENIEDQPAILNQMPSNRRQSGELILNRSQMLKRSER